MRPLLNKWLDHVVKPLLATAKKGGLGIGELLVRACVRACLCACMPVCVHDCACMSVCVLAYVRAC